MSIRFYPMPIFLGDTPYFQRITTMASAGVKSVQSAADDYSILLTILMGLSENAGGAGYSSKGVANLKSAFDIFFDEYRERHPDHWRD